MTRKINIKDNLVGNDFLLEYPIESGSNSNGTWIKYNTGNLEVIVYKPNHML